MTPTPILIGTSGMLGSEFRSYFGELNRGFFPLSRPSFDVSDRESVRKRLLLLKSLGADSVLNCAAATDVSGIELDPRLANESFRANVLGPRYLAETCEDLGLRLVHFSTDYVYSQHSLGTCFGFPVRLEAGTLAFSLPMPEYSFGFIHSVGASLRAGAYRLIEAATDFYCTVSNLVKTGTKRVKHQCIRVMKDIPKAFAHVSRTVLGWRL